MNHSDFRVLGNVRQRALVVLLFLFGTGVNWAQQTSCDEGVVRLPNQSGTIQICSALADKVPQLAKQLSEATQALGS